MLGMHVHVFERNAIKDVSASITSNEYAVWIASRVLSARSVSTDVFKENATKDVSERNAFNDDVVVRSEDVCVRNTPTDMFEFNATKHVFEKAALKDVAAMIASKNNV
jgi:hypothetical protein